MKTLTSIVLMLAMSFVLTTNAPAKSKPVAGTWSGTLVDKMCAEKIIKKGDMSKMKEHEKSCMMTCGKGAKNLGVVVDGAFYSFDAKGNKMAWKLMKNSKADSDIQVTVDGKLKGKRIWVSKIEQKS